MIHVYYNSETGLINSITQSDYDFSSDLPHIEINEMINPDRYKVNLDFNLLEPLPESEWPVILTRNEYY